MRTEDRKTVTLALFVWLAAIAFFMFIIGSTAPAQVKPKPEPDWVAEFEREHAEHIGKQAMPPRKPRTRGEKIMERNRREIVRTTAASLVAAGGFGPEPGAYQVAQLIRLTKGSMKNPPSFKLNMTTHPVQFSWPKARNGKVVYDHGWLVTVTYWATNGYGGTVPGSSAYLYQRGNWLRVR